MTTQLRTSLALSLSLLAGCVTEVPVGMEQLASAPGDAGTPVDDAGSDAGPLDAAPGECTPIDCADPALAVCEGAQCVRNAAGDCAWDTDSCALDGGELPPCTTFDCEGPLLKPNFDPNVLTCGDGSSPVCTRNESGVCGYLCEDSESCGTADGKACGAGKYCMFNLGLCASKDTSGGVCRELPTSCDANLEPVCGCDGATYNNACDAAAKGVNVSFTGECSNEPGLCADGACGPPPGEPSMPCDDSEHRSGISCVATGPEGMCTWQWLECPSQGTCDSSASDLAPGRCFKDEDCKDGTKCEGASICPCDTQCFSPDVPGYCK